MGRCFANVQRRGFREVEGKGCGRRRAREDARPARTRRSRHRRREERRRRRRAQRQRGREGGEVTVATILRSVVTEDAEAYLYSDAQNSKRCDSVPFPLCTRPPFPSSRLQASSQIQQFYLAPQARLPSRKLSIAAHVPLLFLFLHCTPKTFDSPYMRR